MELGEKLRRARMEAEMSQRQLAGDEITRNMLSQIEHGTAHPSMKTLRYLAAKLGKSVSFFLDETVTASPNQGLMETARHLYDTQDPAGAVLALEGYQFPDPIYDREKALLWVLCHLQLAGLAIAEGREPYALSLLEKAAVETTYCSEDLERRRLLLLGRIRGQKVSHALPSLDGELLLRAGEALTESDPRRAAQLLEAVEDHHAPRFLLLRGQAHFAIKEYRQAAACFHAIESAYPQAIPLLESCYRELGDYKLAYEYACKQRQNRESGRKPR